jgi:hypothetical protein
VLTIEDKPDRPICSIHGPLRWGWFTDTKRGARWTSWTHETISGLGPVLVPHVCDDPDPTPVRWAPSDAVAARARAGADLARRVLAGEDPFTEEKSA